jgi:prevent-host-death family protein
MQVVTYSHARNNLRSLIDTVCATDEEVLITTQGDQTVMMISLDEYNANFVRIRKEVAQSRKEHQAGKHYSLDEAFELAKKALIDGR